MSLNWRWLRDWVALPLLAWVGVAILAGFVWYCFFHLAGCSPLKELPIPAHLGPDYPSVHEDFGFIAWIAGACVALGAIGAILGFVPVVGPFVPRKAAVAAIAIGVGLYFLRDFMVHWLPAIRWIALSLAVIGIVPFVVMYVRWSINRVGAKLSSNGHREAGVALMSAARGWVKDTVDHKLKRKDLLASVGGVGA